MEQVYLMISLVDLQFEDFTSTLPFLLLLLFYHYRFFAFYSSVLVTLIKQSVSSDDGVTANEHST